MSILKDIQMPTLPLALGLLLSAGLTLQNAALPAQAQGEAVASPQMGSIEAVGGDSDSDTLLQFALLPGSEMEALHMGPGGHEGGEGGWHHGFSEANKLSDDQLERLYAIKEDTKDQLGAKKVAEQSLHRRLRDVLSSANIDASQAKDLESKIIALKTDMSTIKMDAMIKAAQVFTPEQRHELRIKMLRGSMHHHHHWGHGPSHEHHEGMGK